MKIFSQGDQGRWLQRQGRSGLRDFGERSSKLGDEWTAFIDNLSKRVSRGALREFFNNYGEVRQVFIPRSIRNPGIRIKECNFVFVRFAPKADMDNCLRSTNDAKIDGRSILVSKAKFTRYSQAGFKEKWGEGKVMKKSKDRRESTIQRKVGVEKERDERSFADVLKGKEKLEDGPVAESPNDVNKVVEAVAYLEPTAEDEKVEDRESPPNVLDFQVPSEDVEWIEHSLVGLTRGNFDLDLVQRALEREGVNAIIWGSFIDVDESTRDMENFSSARMVVRAACRFDIPESVTIRSKGRFFVIKVEVPEEDSNMPKSPVQGVEIFADVWPTEANPVHENSDSDGGGGFESNAPARESVPAVSKARLEVGNVCAVSGSAMAAGMAAGGLLPLENFNKYVHENDENSNMGGQIDERRLNEDGLIENGKSVNGGCQELSAEVDIHSQSGFMVNGPKVTHDVMNGPNSLVATADLSEEEEVGLVRSFVGQKVCGIRLSRDMSSMDFVPDSRKGAPIPRAVIRRVVRRLTRDSIEDRGRPNGVSREVAIAKEISAEAEAVWEGCKVLQVSFKGGKEAVKKRIRSLEAELRRLS
ncbi:hypothetical protein F3Y22_tig00110415pilonHSYRG00166 [Hibiscus syriacus]|uniref:RRM domain-containing protein n=1 Tax=Hibiscus syriacus TaxID=106335 RepID=A0A6A3ARC8_HIBSY|nr:hypothetical protein F3Y22_tig00110415pilonHSYRG00166 [Hibiscus syriacus]